MIQIIEKAIDKWKANKAIGTMFVNSPIDDKAFLLYLLQTIYIKNKNIKVTILCNDFNERTNIIEFILNQESKENNEEFKNLLDSKTLKIFTKNIVQNSYSGHQQIVIVYRLKELYNGLIELLNNTQYKLIMLNRLLTNVDDMNNLYNVAPFIDAFNNVDTIRNKTPVEEVLIETIITNDDDIKLLNYYNDYITTSLNIFGNFDKVNEANNGNIAANISAMQVCTDIAHNNGWNEHLDMSIEYNIKIDELYNPIAIKERASKTYEMIRERQSFLSNNNCKLEYIKNIVDKHLTSKILIINKKYEFADIISEYLNECFGKTIAKPYHNHLLPILAVDDEGNPIYYKSGNKKGKQKVLADKSQRSKIEEDFNNGKINIISANNAIDKDLSIDVDVVIITSPLCNEIEDFIYRLSNINFGNKISLYTLYISNSIEEKRIITKLSNTNHTIVNRAEIEEKRLNFSEEIFVD